MLFVLSQGLLLIFSKSRIGLNFSQQWPQLLPQSAGLPGIRYAGNNKYPGGAKRLDQFTGDRYAWKKI